MSIRNAKGAAVRNAKGAAVRVGKQRNARRFGERCVANQRHWCWTWPKTGSAAAVLYPSARPFLCAPTASRGFFPHLQRRMVSLRTCSVAWLLSAPAASRGFFPHLQRRVNGRTHAATGSGAPRRRRECRAFHATAPPRDRKGEHELEQWVHVAPSGATGEREGSAAMARGAGISGARTALVQRRDDPVRRVVAARNPARADR